MDIQLSQLYKQIKDKKISHEDAVKQLKLFGTGERQSALPQLIPDVSENVLQERAEDYFKKLLSSVINVSPNKIDENALLEKYGIDSIMIMDMTNRLEEVFGSLTKTLFYEYKTIGSVAEYFVKNYTDQLIKVLGLFKIEEKQKAISSTANDTEEIIQKMKSDRDGLKRSRFISMNKTSYEKKQIERSDIAIIGISGRYPQSENIEQFWNNLYHGRDCIAEIPHERWDYTIYFDEDKNKPGKMYCKWGGFLEDVDKFDPLFFNISPREAKNIDPQERLFLMTVWNTLESAGYTRELLRQKYQSKIGVYVGAMYQLYNSADPTVVTISTYYSIANRVSYFFDFQGPSIAIDTACSSALFSVHMACEDLIKGNCAMAIAGGVNLSIHPKKYLGLSSSRMIGSNPQSRSFANGDGYLPSEGVGAVLLKPLSNAIQDRDEIQAVIKSTAVNHGGRTNGFTVPNPNAQAQLIEDNFIKSGIDPRSISYVESAANGSPTGDSIEIAALTRVFDTFTRDKNFCSIGSVKSNIGHGEAASGIAQLTKVVLQLKNKKLVPSLLLGEINPDLHFEKGPFYLQRELQEWKRPVMQIDGKDVEFPRRATVSSFGAGGANAHIIIEEYSPIQGISSNLSVKEQPQIIIFSAKNSDRLQTAVRQMSDYIKQQEKLALADIAYTLQVGREAMEVRLAMVVNTKEELFAGINDYLERREIESRVPIFLGDLDNNKSGIRKLLSGRAGAAVLQILLEEKNLEKLALHWVEGGIIPWSMIHEGNDVRIITLPTYPFEKQRCWIDTLFEPMTSAEKHQPGENSSQKDSVIHTHQRDKDSITRVVIEIVVRLLQIKPTELSIEKPLIHYGIDSIILLQFFQELQARLDPSISLERLKECKTTEDVVEILIHNNDKSGQHKQPDHTLIQDSWSEYPELIHLNESKKGRPVFWFHAGLGGAETYTNLAPNSNRPFYGIQPKGWMTDRVPLTGIDNMAEYYIEMMKKVEPTGPYDIGGYSLGGAIAYEVMRQLQLGGESVDTIVMLDTLDTAALKKLNISSMTLHLQGINFALMAIKLQNPEKFKKQLIHQNEVNADAGEEEFVSQLVSLARQKGLKKSKDLLKKQIIKGTEIQKAFNMQNFHVVPLSNPDSVKCYYFRNKNRMLNGWLHPYFTLPGDENYADHTRHWDEWERNITDMHIFDLDAPNHLMLLSDKKVYETIFEFCSELYSENGISEEFLQSFEERTIQKHGVLRLD